LAAVSVDERLRVDVRTGPDRTVVVLHGELDLAAASALSEQMTRAQEESAGALVLDLEDLQFIDSAGLRVLLAANDRARKSGRGFALTPGSPQVQRLLKVAGVSDHLQMLSSADAALADAPPGPDGG
jgi:anti-anti-sigma factor